MGRYLTRRYVAVSWAAAVELAQLDGTPAEQIRATADAELIHRTDWWAWWSDEGLTTAIGLPENLQPQSLSPDAVELITDVWCSDSPSPRCGWGTLAQVQRIMQCEPIRIGTVRGSFRPETWERLTIAWRDGQQGVLYRFWLGYEGGYLCEIQTEPPAGLWS